MKKEKNIKVGKIIEYFKQKKIDEEKLNKLFYYSLFDSTNFEGDEDYFPLFMVKDFRDNIKRLIKEIFTNKKEELYQICNHPSTFNEFERKIIATDILSKIILQKQLFLFKIHSRILKSGEFDLKIGKDIILELKRICLWTNYTKYFEDFLKKVKGKKYIFLVGCTHPFKIEKMVSEKGSEKILNNYFKKLIRSNCYLTEKLLNKKNVVLVVGYVDKEGKNGNNLSSICLEIKEKIKRWKESK